MKKYTTLCIITFFVALFFCMAANAVTIKSIVTDSWNVPFILDENGDVWAFRYPSSLEEPVKLPGLHHIKKIAPFIALAEDGNVYTWALDKKTKMEDEINMDAYYTAPKLVKGISHVTDIDSAIPKYFVVIENNQRVYEWQENLANFIMDKTIVNPAPKMVYSHEGIKSVATLGNRTTVLLENNTILGWGDNYQKQLGGDERNDIPLENLVSFTLAEPIEKVFMTNYHTIALTKSGHAFFWGDCIRFNNQKADGIKAVSGAMNDISMLAKTILDDNTIPNVYLKKDGSVWLEYAPSPNNTEQCQNPHKIYDYQASTYAMKGMTVPAIAIANGGDGASIYNAIALGSDNTLWGASTAHPNNGFRKIEINLNDLESK